MLRSEDLKNVLGNKIVVRFSGSEEKKSVRPSVELKELCTPWGCSSAGRAPALQAGGQEFDSPHLHHGNNWLPMNIDN